MFRLLNTDDRSHHEIKIYQRNSPEPVQETSKKSVCSLRAVCKSPCVALTLIEGSCFNSVSLLRLLSNRTCKKHRYGEPSKSSSGRYELKCHRLRRLKVNKVWSNHWLLRTGLIAIPTNYSTPVVILAQNLWWGNFV